MYERGRVLHPTSQFGRFATVMEYLGNRNKLIKFYEDDITPALTNSALKIYGLDFPNFGNEGKIEFSFAVENIMNYSSFMAIFLPLPTESNRIFVNYQGKQPQNDEQINIKLEGVYTESNKDKLFYDVITKTIGKKCADKYNDILDSEFFVDDFNETLKTAKITPKPGSKIFAASTKVSEFYTEMPYYQLNISW